MCASVEGSGFAATGGGGGGGGGKEILLHCGVEL